MKRRVTILQKGLLLIALPLLYQALFIGVLLRRQHEHNEAQRLAVHTTDVLAHLDRLYRLALEAQSSVHRAIIADDPAFGEVADQALQRLTSDAQWLRRLLADNPRQQSQLDQLLNRLAARMEWQESTIHLIKTGRAAEAREQIRRGNGQRLMDALRNEIDTLRQNEERVAEERLSALRKSSLTQNWLLVGGLVLNVAIGGLCAVAFSRGISRRLAILTQNTERLGRGERLVDLVSGSDEISELDQRFHVMSQELAEARQKERAFQSILERRNEELLRANRELDLKSQENEMFVYSVSHDLRSPLVNLQGFSKELGLIRDDLRRLLDGDLSEAGRKRARLLIDRDVAESIHYIQTAVTRLSSIIDALLRLSRAGRVEYNPELVDVCGVVTRVLEAMRGTIAQRGAEVKVHDLPPVWADATAIEQVLANLIGNAVNYLDPSRPGQIEIGCLAPAPAGLEDFHVYYVKDNGLGIAEAYLPKVFAVFQRLHASVAPGEGIGLALVRRRVERHGGKVWVESKEGEGSTFFVALPASRESSPLTVAPKKESIRLLARTP